MIYDRVHFDILAEVRVNRERLDSCSLHEFAPLTAGLFGTKYVCAKCRGEVDGLTAKWYDLGVKHGKTSL